MVTLAILAGFIVAWLAAEMGSQMEGASITAEVGRATLRGMEKSWDGIKGGVNGVHHSIYSIVFEQRQPLELPEWTGRERESLRADLEAAEKSFMSSSWVTKDTLAEELEEYPAFWEEKLPSIVQSHGIFPEALEAFMGEKVPEEKMVRLPMNSKIINLNVTQEVYADTLSSSATDDTLRMVGSKNAQAPSSHTTGLKAVNSSHLKTNSISWTNFKRK